MTTICTTPADLATTNANLVALATRIISLEASRTADEAAIADALRRLGVDEGVIAGLLPPVPPIVIPPPYDPQILWKSGMESGDLSAWSNGPAGDNTGFAASSAVQVALEGITPRVSKLFNLPSVWAMKQAITAPSGTAEASGTRMSRYPEINALCKAGTPFYYSWWDFFPVALAYPASGWYNHWQIMSVNAANANAPIWVLSLSASGMNPILVWSPTAVLAEGPHAGEAGTKAYTSTLAVPVGQWVFFEVMVKPASDFTGALKMWLNGQVLFDLSAIKTQFPLATQSLYAYIANNCYGFGFPTPWGHYVDDVTVSLGRMP
jgi:hypothetical protein